MLFSSYTFLICFLPVLIVIYYLVPKSWRNYLLLCASLIFYAWGGVKYLFVMLLSIFINYICGILVSKAKQETTSRTVLILSVILNLSLLGYYKYTDFVIGNINAALGTDLPLKNILLPIGISFYTFQGMSYVFDVHRKRGKVLLNPLKLALYISLFPQLIAGPIVRYETIAGQIDERSVDPEDLNKGIYRFMIGLSKKVLLSNTIGELATQCFSMDHSSLTLVSSWVGALAFTLQIYFDFSGYSDMAIGLGRIFGFRFNENFNYPYISLGITDFWRRWHISLSTWFRDYVYIPLGGNRKGKFRQYINILIVWILTGLWHGASWNFVVWGLYYAVLLIIEKIIRDRISFSIPLFLHRVYTIILVMIGWVLFESPTLTDALSYIKKMFDFTYRSNIWGKQLLHYGQEYGLFLALGCIFCFPVYQAVSVFLEKKVNKHALAIIRVVFMVLLFSICLMRLIVSSYNPFIYFRF